MTILQTYQCISQLHLHGPEYATQLNSSLATLIHIIFDHVSHGSEKFIIGKCNYYDYITLKWNERK